MVKAFTDVSVHVGPAAATKPRETWTVHESTNSWPSSYSGCESTVAGHAVVLVPQLLAIYPASRSMSAPLCKGYLNPLYV